MTTRKETPFSMLNVPGIPAKPRTKGLTIISDRTIPLGVMKYPKKKALAVSIIGKSIMLIASKLASLAHFSI